MTTGQAQLPFGHISMKRAGFTARTFERVPATDEIPSWFVPSTQSSEDEMEWYIHEWNGRSSQDVVQSFD